MGGPVRQAKVAICVQNRQKARDLQETLAKEFRSGRFQELWRKTSSSGAKALNFHWSESHTETGCDTSESVKSACADGLFQCNSSGLCIEQRQRCDGNYDCSTSWEDDQSDEWGCTSITCDFARCPKNGNCIDSSQTCPECADV